MAESAKPLRREAMTVEDVENLTHAVHAYLVLDMAAAPASTTVERR